MTTLVIEFSNEVTNPWPYLQSIYGRLLNPDTGDVLWGDVAPDRPMLEWLLTTPHGRAQHIQNRWGEFEIEWREIVRESA